MLKDTALKSVRQELVAYLSESIEHNKELIKSEFDKWAEVSFDAQIKSRLKHFKNIAAREIDSLFTRYFRQEIVSHIHNRFQDVEVKVSIGDLFNAKKEMADDDI